MSDKVLGVVSLGLSAFSQAFISHHDTAMFYAWLFGIIGVYEFVRGELGQRQSK